MLSLLPPTAAQLLVSSTAQRDYSSFSASMQSYYRAEICKLVGVYLLNQSSIAIDKSAVGLYRDGGLAAINNANSPKLNRMRRKSLHYSHKKYFQSPLKQTLSKQVFWMLSSALRQRNTALLERLTIHQLTILTPFLTIFLQSSNSSLK